MRKLKFIFMLLVLTLFISLNITKTNHVSAASDEFENINLVAYPKISDRDKVSCKITWETKQKITYIEIVITLQNGKQQHKPNKALQSGFSSKKIVNDNKEEVYLNTLEFDLSNHQSGNMKIRFDYSYMPTSDMSNMQTCTYVFATGSWIDKQPPYIALISGMIITVCCGITTYVIIENSHRIIGYNEQNDEDEINE